MTHLLAKYLIFRLQIMTSLWGAGIEFIYLNKVYLIFVFIYNTLAHAYYNLMARNAYI